MSFPVVHRSQGPIAARGLSLVELMVAMALSLLLLTGVVAIFMSSRSSYETTDRLSRIQENGRYALDQVVSDIRAAGFPGCARAPKYVHTTLTSTSVTDLKWNFLDAPVRGFQNTGSTSFSPTIAAADVPSAAAGSDVLLVRRPRRDVLPLRLQADMISGTSAISVPNTTTSGLRNNDVAIIYSCEARTVFQVTSFAGGSIAHTVGGVAAETATTSAAPGNESDDLNYPFRRNAEVIPVETVIYYIRPNAAGTVNSLWRRIGANTPEEIVEGVEQMQLRFGVDTTGDMIVDSYQTANAVTNWDNVYSVEVALLVRSMDSYGGDPDTETYQLLDATFTPAANDRLMREVFTATTALRNRMRVN